MVKWNTSKVWIAELKIRGGTSLVPFTCHSHWINSISTLSWKNKLSTNQSKRPSIFKAPLFSLRRNSFKYFIGKLSKIFALESHFEDCVQKSRISFCNAADLLYFLIWKSTNTISWNFYSQKVSSKTTPHRAIIAHLFEIYSPNRHQLTTISVMSKWLLS